MWRYWIVSFFASLVSMHVCAVSPNIVVATINVGVTPAGMAITPDGRFAYVANNNNYPVANSDTISVLNLANNTVIQTIRHSSFNQPYTVTINPAGTKAYVTNSNALTITVIDIASNSVINVIGGFDGPSGMVITPDGNRAYVNNYGAPGGVGSGNGTTVRVVDLNTDTIIGAPIFVDQAPASLAITPDGAFVYVINYVDGNIGTGTIRIIQTATNLVVGTITGFSGPFAIVITPDGRYAYITNFGSNNFTPIGSTVSVVEIGANKIVATINLAIQPSGIAITPDGRFAYVSNYNSLYSGTVLMPGQGTVNVIDIATNTVMPFVIPVGQSPSAIVIAPDGRLAYVSNFTSNTVSVLNIFESMWL